MEEDDILLATVSAVLLLSYCVEDEKIKKKKKKPRRIWVKPWIQERDRLGAYNALICEFTLHEREDYRRFMRMNTETFHELLEKIRPYITKKETHLRKPISPEEKLAVTLRFLATGEDYAHTHARALTDT